MEKNDKSLLGGYRGLDLTDENGHFCGKILADLGADIIKIEPPGGDHSRNIGPFYHDIPDPQRSLYWYAFNTNKRGITLDIETTHGRRVFTELVKTADFIIESSGYLDKVGLGYLTLSSIKPDIILTSIFPFGRTGPYRDFKASDIVLMAMGGQMYTSGDTDRPPVRISVEQAHLQAGTHAAVGTLAALHHRNKSGEGQQVDVSMMEAVVELVTMELIWWKYYNILFRRGGPRRPRIDLEVRNTWPCKDGQVSFMLVGGGFGRTIRPLIGWMDSEGMAGPLKEVNWETFGLINLSREENELWEETFKKFFLKYTKAELYEQALKLGFPLAQVNTFQDVLKYEQLSSRNFWLKVEHPELGETITYPGFPYHFSETPLSIKRRAPMIGEHNQEIEAELELLPTEGPPPPGKIETLNRKAERKSPPLEGIKVIDFTWVVAGPLIGNYLANLGAEVIKIENASLPDLTRVSEPYKGGARGATGLNSSYHFNLWNSSKLSLGLNLNDPRGVEIAKKLILWADVVVESFTPGKMKKRNLDYHSLKQLKPDIIMLSVSTQGQSGKLPPSAGFGWILNALCGFIHANGWPDRDGVPPHLAYTDFIVPWYGTIAILAALDYRRRTGRGQYIDVSHLETGLTFLAPALLDYTINGCDQGRRGNYSDYAAPHGVYPCQGEDRWCAIAIFSDEEWKAFCQVIGNPESAYDSRFVDFTSRKKNEEELNLLVSNWTRNHSAEEVVNILQKVGVAAGVVQGARELLEDPQLKQQGYLQELEHPEIGPYLQPNWPIKLAKTPLAFRPAPCFGEHTEYVCHQILGMSEAEITELITADVLQLG